MFINNLPILGISISDWSDFLPLNPILNPILKDYQNQSLLYLRISFTVIYFNVDCNPKQY